MNNLPSDLSAKDGLVAVAASFTSEPLQESLEFWLRKLNLRTRVALAPYNQVLPSLLDSRGLFASNTNGLNVVLVRIEDWERFRKNADDRPAYLMKQAQELLLGLKTAARTSPSPILFCLCPSSPAFIRDAAQSALVSEIERSFLELASFSNVRFLSSTQLQELYPVKDYYDETADKLGHIPFKPEMYTAIGTAIARHLHTCKRPPFKVIVLDCDNTLWAGVCGEKGPHGVVIDSPRRALQDFMKTQQKKGMLLCVCSKNNPEDVEATFRAHAESPLAIDDFVGWRVNWQPKSENIRSLAVELELGLDSFIFVDDNPMETAEVRARCPNVLALTLPEDVERIPRFLEHVWAFDQLGSTGEDRKRTEMYQQNSQRNRVRSESSSYADFLANLQIEIDIRELEEQDIPRAAQMTLRTNQFNLTTKRHSEADIRRMLEAGEIRIFTVSVRDRFGDYGQVGLVMYDEVGGRLRVQNFLLSCRVLGKGVEHAMLARLGRIASERSLSHVDVAYVPSAKNAPARNFMYSFDPALRQDLDQGFICRFPAAHAASIKFSAAEEEQEAEVPEAQPAAAQSVTPSPTVNFEWIATNACEAKLVLEAITAGAQTRVLAAGRAIEPPRNEIESQLIRIWEQVLKISPIGIHDSFFDLGGDSLLAVRVFVEIDKLYGKELPLVTLFEAPTIAELAELLTAGEVKPRWRSLVPIKSSGMRPPFYCVHGVGGNILEFMDLARHISADQPLYGIQAIGLNGDVPRQNLTVEEMAKHYIREIREFQPEGPYYIGGSSFGGRVAYEMARQLVADGQQVALLGLFDTYGPGYPKRLPTRHVWRKKLDEQRYRFHLHWSNLLATTADNRGAYVRIKTKRLINELSHAFGRRIRSARRKIRERWDRMFWPDAIREVNKAGHWAAGDYVPKMYAGRLTLFRATEQPRGIYANRSLGWETVVQGGIDIYDTPGHHGAIVRDPRANVLARQLDDALTKAHQQWNASGAPANQEERQAHYA